jgi:hypothetical protein
VAQVGVGVRHIPLGPETFIVPDSEKVLLASDHKEFLDALIDVAKRLKSKLLTAEERALKAEADANLPKIGTASWIEEWLREGYVRSAVLDGQDRSVAGIYQSLCRSLLKRVADKIPESKIAEFELTHQRGGVNAAIAFLDNLYGRGYQTDAFIPDTTGREIMRELEKQKTRMFQIDLAQAIDRSRRTVGSHLADLCKHKYVERVGRKRGYAITSKGTRYLRNSRVAPE